MRFKPSGNTLALTLTGTNAAIAGKATSTQTAASDSSITLTTKSYVDGLVTGVPVYKGTWAAGTTGVTSAAISSTTITLTAAPAETIAIGDVVTADGITAAITVTAVGSQTSVTVNASVTIASGVTVTFSPTGGYPNLTLAANKVLGNYYIVSTTGSAAPNGAGTEPDSWNVGDWCIFSDITPGAGTDLWQKIDNTSVISGAGTGQKVTKWEGAGPSETLTDGPITFSTNDSTFAGKILNTYTGTGSHELQNATNNGTVLRLTTTGDGRVLTLQTDHIFSNGQLFIGDNSYATNFRGSAYNFANGNATFAGILTVQGAGAASYGSLSLVSSDSFIRINTTGGTADKRKWDIRTVSANGFEALDFRTVNDANNSFSTKLSIAHSGAATFADKINLSSNKSVDWGGGSIRAEGNTLKLVATTLIDLQQKTQIIGNVGIGGSPSTTERLKLTGQQHLLQLTRGGGSDSKWFFSADSAKLYIAEDTTATSNIKVTIIDTGNVGIGTTTPALESGGTGLHINAATNSELKFTNNTTGVTASDGTALVSNSNNFSINNREAGFLTFGTSNLTRMVIDPNGKVGIGATGPAYRLDVNGGVRAGGKVTYTKSAGSLNTTGYAVAGITALPSGNGFSCGFTFTCFGGVGKYQKLVYSCYNSGGTWNAKKVIDEGTNDLDVVASANGSTITFTFKAKSSTQSFTPRVTVEAAGTAINSTYA